MTGSEIYPTFVDGKLILTARNHRAAKLLEKIHSEGAVDHDISYNPDNYQLTVGVKEK